MTKSFTIPAEIRRYIVQCIPSVPFLEAVLLMREQPAHCWDHRQLAQRLYLDEPAAHSLLEQIRQAGLLSEDAPGSAQYRYRPDSPALAAMLDRVAAAYAQNLIEVSTLIHLKSSRKAQVFADAFVLRKKEL